MKNLELKSGKYLKDEFLSPALEYGFVEMTQPDSPRSPTQKYRLTTRGRAYLESTHAKNITPPFAKPLQAATKPGLGLSPEVTMQVTGQKNRQKTGMKTSMKAGMKTRQKIIEMLRETPGISITAISGALRLARSSVIEQVSKLKAQGRLRRIGPDKGGHWEVVDK